MGIGFFVRLLSMWASDDVGHFKRDNDLELARWSWLQAYCAHICIRVVEVAARETPPTLRDRRVECRSPGQPHVGRTCSLVGRCIVEVLLDPLCQDLSNAYVRGNISAHGSLRREELCPCAVRYDHSSSGTIVDILILIQICSNGVLSREDTISCGDGIVIINTAYAEMPWILLFNSIQSRWTSLGEPHIRTLRTEAILGGRIFALLVRRHVWLESGAGKLCSRWIWE